MRVITNLNQKDSCFQEEALAGLIQKLGFEPVELQKSLWNGDHDNPELRPLKELVELARNDFDRYGEQLIEVIQKLIDEDRLFPLDHEKFEILRKIFEDHNEAFLIRFAGWRDNYKLYKRLKNMGLITSEIGYVDISYKMGKIVPLLRLISQGVGKFPSLKEIVHRAMAQPLSPPEKKALTFARHHAAERMRPVLDMFAGRVRDDLLDFERRYIREEIATGIKKRIGALRLSSKLRERTLAEGNPTSRDYERVARTELIEAYAQGTYGQIKQDYRGKDVFVFKHVAKTACDQCRRIWGTPPNFIYYRLSSLEKHDTNVGKKPKEWTAQVGPIHPQCTEGGLQVWVDLSYLTGGLQTQPSPIAE